jgi:hypothetical protein
MERLLKDGHPQCRIDIDLNGSIWRRLVADVGVEGYPDVINDAVHYEDLLFEN